MDKYKELNEELVQEVQSMRKRLHELRTEIVRMRAEESDKYMENVLQRKQFTKFMLNTCYRFVEMIEPNSNLHEQLGNMLLMEWKGSVHDDDNNINASIRQSKLPERNKLSSSFHIKKGKYSSGVQSSGSTSGANSEMNDSIRRRRSSSQCAAECRRSSNLMQSNSFGSNNSPKCSVDKERSKDNDESEDEGSEEEETDSNEEDTEGKDNQDECNEKLPLTETGNISTTENNLSIQNQVIYEDEEKSTDNEDDYEDSDKDYQTEEEEEEDDSDDNDESQEQNSTTDSCQNGEGSDDVEDSETEDCKANIEVFKPVLMTPKYLSAKREQRHNKANISNMDISMDEDRPGFGRRSTNIGLQDMELAKNNSLFSPKLSFDKSRNSSFGYNSNLNSINGEKEKKDKKRTNSNKRSPLSPLNAQDSPVSREMLINRRDSSLSLNESVERIRDAISTMNVKDTLMPNYQLTSTNENSSSFNSSTSSRTLINSVLSIPPEDNKYDSIASTKLSNIDNLSVDDNTFKSDIFELNWARSTKYSSSTTLSLMSTQCSEQDDDESTLTSRPRRRCRPNSLAEPSLRGKLRNESSVKRSSKRKTAKS